MPKCQNCLQTGHWTSHCKNEPAYRARPSRSAWLKNKKLKPALKEKLPPETEMKEELDAKLKVLRKKYGLPKKGLYWLL